MSEILDVSEILSMQTSLIPAVYKVDEVYMYNVSSVTWTGDDLKKCI